MVCPPSSAVPVFLPLKLPLLFNGLEIFNFFFLSYPQLNHWHIVPYHSLTGMTPVSQGSATQSWGLGSAGPSLLHLGFTCDLLPWYSSLTRKSCCCQRSWGWVSDPRGEGPGGWLIVRPLEDGSVRDTGLFVCEVISAAWLAKQAHLLTRECSYSPLFCPTKRAWRCSRWHAAFLAAPLLLN